MKHNRINIVQVGIKTETEWTESQRCTSLKGAEKMIAKRPSSVYAEYKDRHGNVTKFKRR